MCSHANIIKTGTTAKTTTTTAPVDMANPVCTCTKCACRNIVTFPGGNLCEYCNDNHN
ncbi:hypothetical protein LCI18_003535 [Fusarium solani-melongenae]|uniref:Uncharacterized protein n=1 Tax=Fusarium solani subsp. cucurbitae TaxID=2747967 RepID=A0ACD3YUJ4_FUSSC|nr:hypothetical protein LCI18_003535 [Fusarium solani-melongenae]